MRIALFGLGYVGSVSAACFARAGHDVVGVDVDRNKVQLVAGGRSPVSEPGLDELLAQEVSAGRLRATTETVEAVQNSDLALVCVGTPSRRNGSLDSTYLERVVQQIGEALVGRPGYYVVAIRSTVLPGLAEALLIPLLERTGQRRVGSDLGFCVNPEFLREGSAIRDFECPPFTVIGQSDSRAGDVLLQAYAHLDAPVHRVRPAEASLVKYASNAYHALKVAFSNEIGAVSEQIGVDGRKVMAIFCEDRDLNISTKYLQPGFGFGGSCLPKDLRALNYVAKDQDVFTPLLNSVLASNEQHIRRVSDAVLETGKRRVALLGLSFKAYTDDLRESPFVTLAETLIGKGLALRVYDPDVSLAQLVGRNRAYIEERLPHIAQLLSPDWRDPVAEAEVVILGKWLPEMADLPQVLGGQFVIDLVGVEGLGEAYRPWGAAGDGHPARPVPTGS